MPHPPTLGASFPQPNAVVRQHCVQHCLTTFGPFASNNPSTPLFVLSRLRALLSLRKTILDQLFPPYGFSELPERKEGLKLDRQLF
jgi:hypothetical protein